MGRCSAEWCFLGQDCMTAPWWVPFIILDALFLNNELRFNRTTARLQSLAQRAQGQSSQGIWVKILRRRDQIYLRLWWWTAPELNTKRGTRYFHVWRSANSHCRKAVLVFLKSTTVSQSQRLQGERGQYNNEEYSEQQMRFSSLLFFCMRYVCQMSWVPRWNLWWPQCFIVRSPAFFLEKC